MAAESPAKGSSASGRQVEEGREGHKEVSNGSGWKMELLPSAHVVQKAGDVLSYVSQRRTLVWQTADLCHTPLEGLLPEVMKRSWVSRYFPSLSPNPTGLQSS